MMAYRSAPLDSSLAVGVPLLADSGFITESNAHNKDRHCISGDEFNCLVNFTTLLGCFFGVLAAALTIGATQFLVMGSAHIDNTSDIMVNRLFLVFDVVWCLVVTLVARQLMHRIVVRSFGISHDESNEGSWQVLDLSMAIGTLTGVLVSGAGISFFLGYGFWDKVIMVFGSTAMLILCSARALCLRSNNDSVYLEQEAEEEYPFDRLVTV